MKRSNYQDFLCLLLLFCLYSFPLFARDPQPRHGISIFNTVKYPPDFKHFDYVNPNAPKGGKLTLAVIGTFDSLNPYILRGVAATGLGLTYDTLLETSYDEPSSAYGKLAKSVTVSPTNDWAEFTLRKEARWHDGKPVTVDDVIFTFETLKAKGHPHYRTYYQDVTGVIQTAPDTVRFEFSHNKNRELPLIIGSLAVIPKHYWKNRDFTQPTLKPPPGSGPYRIGALSPGRSITFERVKDYWAKDLPVTQGYYNFDTLVFDYYRDETVALEALKAHKYDLREENISRLWATAYDIPQVRDGRMLKEQLKHQIPAGMQGFYFNTRRSKFQDPRVREALTLAYDYEWANKHLFYGAYQRTESNFANSMYDSSSSVPSAAELKLLEPFRKELDPRIFTKRFSLPKSDGSGYIRDRLLQSRDLLEQAGWVIRDGKLVNDKTGEPMTIEFMLTSPSFIRVVAPYKKNLERLGIDSVIRMVDPSQYQRRLDRFDFDMVTYLYGQGLTPGNEQIGYWHSSQAYVEGSMNYGGVRSDAVDAMVKTMLEAKSQDELTTATRALDRILLWSFYAVPHWNSGTFRLIYWNNIAHPDPIPPYHHGLPNIWWSRSAQK